MPNRARRMCAQPGCAALAELGQTMCAAHAKARNAQRPTAAQRGYGSRWRRVRAMFLADHPVCCDPFGLHPERVVATHDVDHVVPRRRGGADIAENLQPLCRACHNHKTRIDLGRAV